MAERWHDGPVLHVVFDRPLIPGNTGNAIRMTAGVGAHLHLVEPLGFTFDDAHLRRAGLDYHDLADVTVHADFDALVADLDSRGAGTLHAFTGHAARSLADVTFGPDNVLLFGTETTGLAADRLSHPRVNTRVRIPMRQGVRSMNLSNAAAVATYEAWRQNGYTGGV